MRSREYALVMRDHLPAGWRGLLVGAFFAAYMSTVSTQLNWGSSYLVNDVYARFVHPAASNTELVRVSRIATLAVMALSAVVTFYLENVRQAWEFVLESGAGVGLVLILRWYWWRVNAASEISALVAAAIGCVALRAFTDVPFPDSLLYLVPWTTACWLTVTWLTPAEPMPHLIAFYRRVRPGGPGWATVAAAAGAETAGRESLPRLWLDWAAGCVLVYGILFGVGGLFVRVAGSGGRNATWRDTRRLLAVSRPDDARMGGCGSVDGIRDYCGCRPRGCGGCPSTAPRFPAPPGLRRVSWTPPAPPTIPASVARVA